MKCDKCGAEMTYFHEDSSCGWTCPDCGNGLVTTYVEDIDLDETVYTISLNQNNTTKMPAIKLISKLSGKGFVTAKEMLTAGNYSHEGHAKEIKEIAASLKAAGISYKVTPDFPYEV